MNYRDVFQKDLFDASDLSSLVTKYFFLHPTCSFEGRYDEALQIVTMISSRLKIPVNNIYFSGSAKLGFSLHKNTDFRQGISDLDVAIIDPNLFALWLQEAILKSNSYTNANAFPPQLRSLGKTGKTAAEMFQSYASKGIIHPGLMPQCELKQNWVGFFEDLSMKNRSLFKNISGFIYLSENCFRQKQIRSLSK